VERAQQDKKEYYQNLQSLNIEELYHDIEDVMLDSQKCWPADGPQNGDKASYAGLFIRTAWHCAGTFRSIDGNIAGGCEGGRQRFWPENEWHDNSNLDKGRAILAKIKDKYGDKISWGDLMTFAGNVAIRASGGPIDSFCFGRVDDHNGFDSIPLQVEGINGCLPEQDCKTDVCDATFRWPEQDPKDHPNCNSTQVNFRFQASHGIGLIYVHADGPQLRHTEPEVNPSWVHQRSPRLSALEIRDTFLRMGWTDRETVALIAGGHSLGRAHGGCDLRGSAYDEPVVKPFNGQGPFFEAELDSGRGPTSLCGSGELAGLGPNTVTSGFEGA